MRIVHLSDLHAGGIVRSPRGIFDKRLFGMMNHVFRRAHSRKWERVEKAVTKIKMLNPDLVVCTGDLTTISEPAEFQLACDALMPLVKDIRFKFLYVPGNHDNYVARKACQTSLDKAFRTLNGNGWELDHLPIEYEFQGVRFILVDQSVPMPFFSSSGNLSKHTREWVAARLEEPNDKPVVLLNHFPTRDAEGHKLSWRRGCHHNEILHEGLVDGKIKLALCGHIHTPFVREEESGSMEVCAGSLTFTGIMNVIDYDVRNNSLHQAWVRVDDNEVAPAPPQGARALPSGNTYGEMSGFTKTAGRT